ncbi:MAG: Crp/Fnr family transcriptional regulator [Cytophagales bacterium]|nr:MAG: Crp/Fnr family transcriptional regulator [Cytophagales bacterium]
MEEAISHYLESIKTLCPDVDDDALLFLAPALTITRLNARHFYSHANARQTHIGFVFSGLLRAYYIDQSGKEITVNFIGENQFATHYTAQISNQPSRYYFQCIEPCVMVNIPYAHVQAAYEAYPSLERYGRLVVEEILKMQQRRIEALLFDSAEKRYTNFVADHNDLFNRVSLSSLATFLGIERPSLSRIRKKLTRP